MNRRKLDSLLWENIPTSNFIIPGYSSITHENLNGVLWESVDELSVSRDDEYNIAVTCVRNLNRYNEERKQSDIKTDRFTPGETIPAGRLIIKLSDNNVVTFSPMYFNGYESRIDKTYYKLSCYRTEAKYSIKKPSVLREWLLNGSKNGLYFCENERFEYKVEGAVSGKYGDLEFPHKEFLEEQEIYGGFTHIKYKDTAFDIQIVGSNYGPSWSTNLSISYFEKYGRIPNNNERKQIREYVSFFIGKSVIYIGETLFDDNGDELGFVMENPRTYGFDIKKLCMKGEKTPIRCNYEEAESYFKVVQQCIDPFSQLYDKLDFASFFSAYWYAKEMAKPMDLPVLAGALENLKRKWYEEVEKNPETVLMDKTDFAKRIKPIKELLETQFQETQYADRMKNALYNMNRMSVSEQITHFFAGIGLKIGEAEKKALKARNYSAHGSYGENDCDYREQCRTSSVYECLIARVILKLLNYEGEYVDYGTIGFPSKSIDCPSGDSED